MQSAGIAGEAAAAAAAAQAPAAAGAAPAGPHNNGNNAQQLALPSRKNLAELFVTKDQMLSLVRLDMKLRGECRRREVCAAEVEHVSIHALLQGRCTHLPQPSTPSLPAELRAARGEAHVSPLQGAVVRIRRGHYQLCRISAVEVAVVQAAEGGAREHVLLYVDVSCAWACRLLLLSPQAGRPALRLCGVLRPVASPPPAPCSLRRPGAGHTSCPATSPTPAAWSQGRLMIRRAGGRSGRSLLSGWGLPAGTCSR